jgi:hypothetical protein
MDQRRPKAPEQVKAEMEGTEKGELAGGDPRLQETYEFDFRFETPRGEVFAGRFRNHILTIKEWGIVASLRSQFVGGAPWDSLDPSTQVTAEMLCHLVQSLENLEDVGWAKQLSQLRGATVLEALYEEVSGHEAIFSGRQAPDGGGAGKGDVDA